MKLFAGLIGAVLLVSSPTYAENGAAGHEQRKATWETLSDTEKLQKLEKRRMEFRERRDAEWKRRDVKWNSMSDQEKIRHAEKMIRENKPQHGGQ